MTQKTVLIPFEKYQRLLQVATLEPRHIIREQQNNTHAATEEQYEHIPNDHRPEADKKLEEALIISALPIASQKRAQHLLTFITAQKLFTWNEKGQLVVEGEIHPGTHIIDLIRDSQSTFKKEQPPGSDIFYHLLGKGNIPLAFIRNTPRHQYLHHQMSLSSPTPKPQSQAKQRQWLSWS